MKGFPTRAPGDLEDRPRQQRWLVDRLWARQAVGIVGGEPKCGRSFLALDLAVAVAAGVPCLRRFAAAQPGPVLMFAAEDAGHIVRSRLAGIARAAGTAFDTLDIAVIDVPTLRLDHRLDRQRLLETVERVGPRLLVLDPLVRLHGVDENTVAARAAPSSPQPLVSPARSQAGSNSGNRSASSVPTTPTAPVTTPPSGSPSAIPECSGGAPAVPRTATRYCCARDERPPTHCSRDSTRRRITTIE